MQCNNTDKLKVADVITEFTQNVDDKVKEPGQKV